MGPNEAIFWARIKKKRGWWSPCDLRASGIEKPMNQKQFCESLDVKREKVLGWIARGLPCTKVGRRYKFDPAIVRSWLPENGLATDIAHHVVTTRVAISQHFNVSTKTVGQWKAKGMPLLPDGTYDLVAIDAWLREHGRGPYYDSLTSDAHIKLLKIQVEREQYKLDQLRRDLIPVEIVGRFLEKHTADVQQVLDDLPKKLMAVLPRSLPKRRLAEIRHRTKKLIGDAVASFDDLQTSSELSPAEQL